MKAVGLFICAFLAWSALAADQLTECAAIESAVERLDCYDRLASQQARQQVPQQTPSQASELPAQQPDTRTEEERVAKFGKPHRPDPEEEFEAVEARIESVRKAPLGQQVMTLSNGQIWMENEPGRRTIAPDQPVTIRKHRWHYEMELTSQPNVTVRRVD